MSGEWHTGRPPDHGYYLGAWKHGRRWVVSELWFNPDSIGTGWWPSRGYLRQEPPGIETIAVEAWMPMPVYKPASAADSALGVPFALALAVGAVRVFLGMPGGTSKRRR